MQSVITVVSFVRYSDILLLLCYFAHCCYIQLLFEHQYMDHRIMTRVDVDYWTGAAERVMSLRLFKLFYCFA
jgi:hypothetical protein